MSRLHNFRRFIKILIIFHHLSAIVFIFFYIKFFLELPLIQWENWHLIGQTICHLKLTMLRTNFSQLYFHKNLPNQVVAGDLPRLTIEREAGATHVTYRSAVHDTRKNQPLTAFVPPPAPHPSPQIPPPLPLISAFVPLTCLET